MKYLRLVMAQFCLVALLAPSLAMADSVIAIHLQLFGEVDKQLEQAREAQVEVLSPDRFERAMKYYKSAESTFRQGRNMESVRTDIGRTQNWLSKAMEATEIGSITFAQAIQARANAMSADAPKHAVEEWSKAEQALRKAATEVEKGDLRRAKENSRSVADLFQQAELQAIKTNYLSGARTLLEQAKKERADRYATKTFIDAKLLLEQAAKELTENRYDTDYPRDLARRARNEAQHAITITRLSIGVKKKDFAVEDIITNYEKPLINIADALNIVPSLHEGYEPTRDAILASVVVLKKEAQAAAQLRLLVEEQSGEIARMSEQLGVKNEQLAAEERYRALLAELESIFETGEAEVFRQGKSMIIRMIGLNFASGKSELTDEHRRLLAKVTYAITLSKTELTTIEGHTDSHGADESNMLLSEERARAVVDYLHSGAQLAAANMIAVGYGETRPIANNESAAGREKNRRIDVVIELEREKAKAAPQSSSVDMDEDELGESE